MATAGAGCGGGDGFGRRGGLGRGVFAGRKLRNDDEAGSSSLRPPVTDTQREATRIRGAKSCSAESRSWASCRRLGRIFDPALQRLRAAENAWWQAREAAAAGDVAVAARLQELCYPSCG